MSKRTREQGNEEEQDGEKSNKLIKWETPLNWNRDVLFDILSFLNEVELCAVSRVNKVWKQQSESNSLWIPILYRLTRQTFTDGVRPQLADESICIKSVVMADYQWLWSSRLQYNKICNLLEWKPSSEEVKYYEINQVLIPNESLLNSVPTDSLNECLRYLCYLYFVENAGKCVRAKTFVAESETKHVTDHLLPLILDCVKPVIVSGNVLDGTDSCCYFNQSSATFKLYKGLKCVEFRTNIGLFHDHGQGETQSISESFAKFINYETNEISDQSIQLSSACREPDSEGLAIEYPLKYIVCRELEDLVIQVFDSELEKVKQYLNMDKKELIVCLVYLFLPNRSPLECPRSHVPLFHAIQRVLEHKRIVSALTGNAKFSKYSDREPVWLKQTEKDSNEELSQLLQSMKVMQFTKQLDVFPNSCCGFKSSHSIQFSHLQTKEPINLTTDALIDCLQGSEECLLEVSVGSYARGWLDIAGENEIEYSFEPLDERKQRRTFDSKKKSTKTLDQQFGTKYLSERDIVDLILTIMNLNDYVTVSYSKYLLDTKLLHPVCARELTSTQVTAWKSFDFNNSE